MEQIFENIVENWINGNRGDVRKMVQALSVNYMRSEGCSCYQDIDGHREHKKRLAKLLNVPMYSDKSGYNFTKFQSKKP